MRMATLTVMTTAVVGLAVISYASATPISGGGIGETCAAMNSLTQVQHWRWSSGLRWRSGRCNRCNGRRCWWIC